MEHRRRIDRVLADDYLASLEDQPTDVLRRMRDECEEEESGISYARRVLQGRLDIVRAEVRRRHEEGDGVAGSILASLPGILADEGRTSSVTEARPARHLVPPAVKYHRREIDNIADDQSLTDVRKRPTDELSELAQELSDKERELSEVRKALFECIDRIQAELIQRYKSGAADVSEVLTPRS